MKPKSVKISIITVCFHNSEETIACLNSFNKLKYDNLDICFYVVDNEGTPQSTKFLQKKLPQSQVITSSKNIGFAGGCNLAIREALNDRSSKILLINPDTLIESSDFWFKMLATHADLVAPVIKYRENKKITYDYGGVVDFLFGRNTHLKTHSLHQPLTIPDYFTGACLLIGSKVFKKIGYLDEGYFLYYEDADFCLRAKTAGLSLKNCPEATIFHHLSTTTSKIGRRKLSIIANSHFRFCQKHLPFWSLPFYLSYNLYLRFKSL